jgi:hypothetical protein
MSIEVGDITLEAKKRFREVDGHSQVEVAAFPDPTALAPLTPHSDDDVACGVVGRLVGLAFENDVCALGYPAVDGQCEGRCRGDDSGAFAFRAGVFNRSTVSVATITPV